MIVITTPLSVLGLVSIIYLGFLFANFSRRLGAVTKMREHYRLFLIASGLVTMAAVSQVVRATAVLAPERAPAFLLQDWFAAISFHVPLALGVSLNLGLVWYYWGWILKEKLK